MTNYVMKKYVTLLVFLVILVFAVGTLIIDIPYLIKIIVYMVLFLVALIIIPSATNRYTITNDTLITKGIGVANNTIEFSDITKAYIFVKTQVVENKSSKNSNTTANNTSYKIAKYPYMGLELKNGIVVTLDLRTINKDFFSLLEQKINEHNIYYFEMN